MNQSVERLAERYQAGRTTKNLSALVEAMEPTIRTWFRRSVCSPEWADGECLQAGRIKLCDVAEKWKKNGGAGFVSFVQPWIVGAMKNAASDALGVKHGRGGQRDRTLEGIEEIAGCDRTGDESHVCRLVSEQALEALPDTLRIIARLHFIDGLTVLEIATAGRFTPAAVNQLLQQVFARLREYGNQD